MKKENNIIENFWGIISKIPQSYNFIQDKEELRNASQSIETVLIAIDVYSKSFAQKKISLDEFKQILFEIVNNETNELIVVDKDGNEISDEQKMIINNLAIASYDKGQIEKLATEFYRIMSSARMMVFHMLNPNKPIMIMRNNMMPSELGVFDTNKITEISEEPEK